MATVAQAEEDMYRSTFGDLAGDDDLWNFAGLDGGDDEQDWWSSATAHNPSFHHDAPSSSTSYVEGFSASPPRSRTAYQPQPSIFHSRDFRDTSPRPGPSDGAPHITERLTSQHQSPQRLRRRSYSRARRARRPVADYSEDWLDAEALRHHEGFDDIPPDSFSSNLLQTQGFGPSSSYGSDIDIDDLLKDTSGAPDNMPATRASNRRKSVVDLTDSPPSPTFTNPPSMSRKRSVEETALSSSSKRRRVSSPVGIFKKRFKNEPVEELDLTEEAPSAEEELAQAQQQQLIETQRQEAASGPVKMGKRTCIICLDNITNATVTSCGHMFCHECLTQAIQAAEKNSEKGVGGCPVCRKPLKRNKEKQMIPIAFMKRSTFKGKAKRVGP